MKASTISVVPFFLPLPSLTRSTTCSCKSSISWLCLNPTSAFASCMSSSIWIGYKYHQALAGLQHLACLCHVGQRETEWQWHLGRPTQTNLHQGSRLGALQRRACLDRATQIFWRSSCWWRGDNTVGDQSGGTVRDTPDVGILHLVNQSVWYVMWPHQMLKLKD